MSRSLRASSLALLIVAVVGLAVTRFARRAPGVVAVTRLAESPERAAGASPSATPELRHHAVGRDRRESLILQSPGRWRFELPGEEDLALSFAWSVASGDGALRLSWSRPGSLPAPLFAEEATAGGPWLERRVPLGETGPAGWLELRIEGGPGRVAVAAPELTAPREPERPNVLVYLVDCLRADHVGAYGYDRPTTPAIDRLARDAVLFEQAMSCAGWTLPSVGCLFTGQYPPVHGAQTVSDALDPNLPTLAERFADAGFATAAWVANPLLSDRSFGLARGFHRVVGLADFPEGRNPNDIEADAAQITQPVVEWLEQSGNRRFFLYLHSLDLHASYRRRPPFGRIFLDPSRRGPERLVDLYDNELAYNDREIGRLLDALRRLGLYDDTLIALVADHGEEFGEHGTHRHGRSLYDELLHVPLLLKLPGSRWSGQRVAAPTSLVDVGPTLLDLAALPPLEGAAGHSRVPAMRGDPLEPSAVFAEQWPMYAVRGARYKLIEQPLPTRWTLLFDLERDPREKADLAAARPALVQSMRRAYSDLTAASLAGFHIAWTPDGTSGRVRLQVSAPGTRAALRRLQPRSTDRLRSDPERGTLEIVFDAHEPRHMVLRTGEPGQAIGLSAWRDGEPLRSDRVLVAGSSRPASGWPVRAVPATATVDAERLLELSGSGPAGLRLMFVAGPQPLPHPDPSSDERTRRLRALGYLP